MSRKRIALALVGAGVALSVAAAPSALASGPGGSELTKVFLKPVTGYTNSCLFSPAALADFTQITSIGSTCGTTASFSTTMEKRTVPGSWSTWGSPPNTESASPAVLYTIGATSVQITFSKTTPISGAEAEPNPFTVHAVQASWYNNVPSLLGTQVRDINGNAGALLLAAKTKPAAKYLVLSSDVDFSIANLRAK
jgi:hypothetical protein